MKNLICIGATALSVVAGAAATGRNVYIHVGSENALQPWHPYNPGMRCQMLFDRAKINYAGTITEFELEKTVNVSTFQEVKFYLCHTPLSALTANFEANYGGNTPKLVASFATYELPSPEGVYPIPMAETFEYNNRDNLILEITWTSGTGQKVCLLVGKLTAHQCYAYDERATSGTLQDMGYNARIFFDAHPAVAPASFGRVKGLFY
ncbi:MAG: hypothetical protein JSU81_10645 [Candidatus Coatesbacteria bacterium]|nr:MAG: hypothetical protein JSU81_10645 [Candidatus Coatesbacteria bacterium]